jgi:hypothetical protein
MLEPYLSPAQPAVDAKLQHLPSKFRRLSHISSIPRFTINFMLETQWTIDYKKQKLHKTVPWRSQAIFHLFTHLLWPQERHKHLQPITCTISWDVMLWLADAKSRLGRVARVQRVAYQPIHENNIFVQGSMLYIF